MSAEPQGIAIVTGASSGLGRAFARALVTQKIARTPIRGIPLFGELWLVARREERLTELAEELSRLDAALTIRLIPLDLLAPNAITRLEEALAASGRDKPLSILVNNAGYGTYGPLLEVDCGKQMGQIDLNCRVLAESCTRLGPFLGPDSLVINVASLAAFAPLAGFAVYAASKAFVLSLSCALAAEWEGKGIRVHALCPGSVSSEFALVASGGARKEVLHGFSAEKTVDRALKAAGRGAWISVPRFKWQLNRIAGRLFGEKTSARFAWRHLRRPHASNTSDSATNAGPSESSRHGAVVERSHEA